MRIFIGIRLSDNTHEEIERFLEPFKRISTPIKWTNSENVHLTLKFIGEVPPEQYSRIEAELTGGDFNVGAFDLEIAGCGKFGRGKEINILWLGTAKDEKIEELYRRIENSLERLGIAKEDRPFKPHLTVGRNKKQYNFKPIFELLENNSDASIGKCRVHAFQIFKSELFSSGPIYTVLKEIAIDNA